MQISLRMVKKFCEIISMADKLDFPASKNEETTQQKASLSLFLLPYGLLFHTELFLISSKIISQGVRYWDVLASGNIVTKLAIIKTGCVPENNITIIQIFLIFKEKNMLVLQDSSIDELGAFLIYAPIDLSTVKSIFNGGDAKKVSIFPSGFIICPDGHHNLDTYNIENAQNGSIFTMDFQILICHADNNSISLKQQKSAVTSVHNLLSSTVLKIRATLGCSY
ncbi:hypothetical protein H5410_021678 [Solanum commersonii]|uniref:HD-Zip IV C-terminal domain-containing protein n=1 Tax=Solanum commersonii TaxID=4109 RepID=A0A9J5ZD84_SOLCO|nr:hypothetical protein H5410_021678 [Solanum commersonii]